MSLRIFKFIKNNIFGENTENIRNHSHEVSDKSTKNANYLIQPNFKDSYPFSKELFAVEMGKTEIKMNKPEHLGDTILDLSKKLTYE